MNIAPLPNRLLLLTFCWFIFLPVNFFLWYRRYFCLDTAQSFLLCFKKKILNNFKSLKTSYSFRDLVNIHLYFWPVFLKSALLYKPFLLYLWKVRKMYLNWFLKNWFLYLVVLLRAPWTARTSNQSIVKEINPEYTLQGLMLKLKLQYFGLLMGRGDSSEKTLMLGRTEGSRRRGWQRKTWLDSITDSMDMNLR